jgi:hypothetical protein
MEEAINIRRVVQNLTDKIDSYLVAQYGSEVHAKDVQVRMPSISQICYRWLTSSNFPEDTGEVCCKYIADAVRDALAEANYESLNTTGVELRLDFRSRDSSNAGNKVKVYMLDKDGVDQESGEIIPKLDSCRVRDAVTGREFDWTPLARGLQPPSGLIKL